MGVLGLVLTLLAVGLLWVAAAVFGRDTRDGQDWSRRVGDGDGPYRASR